MLPAPLSILLLIVDDLGFGDLSESIPTPAIDRLAAAGVRVTNFYTSPLCSPSRAALYSSRYPYRDGLSAGVVVNGVDTALPVGRPTFIEAFAEQGFETHLIGKWDVGGATRAQTPLKRGFSTFFGQLGAAASHVDHYVDNDGVATWAAACAEAGSSPTYSCGLDLHNGSRCVAPDAPALGMSSVGLYTREAARILGRGGGAAAPQLVVLSHQYVHAPLEVEDRFLEGPCANFSSASRARICAMVRAVDESVANLTALLNEQGRSESTLVVLVSDNGGNTEVGSSNFPLRGSKFTVWEGGVRGVFVAAGGGLPTGGADIDDGLMHFVDLGPTLLSAAGALPHSGFQKSDAVDGIDLWGWLSGGAPAAPRRETVLIKLNPPSADFAIGQYALRSGDWKLVVGQPQGEMRPRGYGDGWWADDGSFTPPPDGRTSGVFLFDLANDPNETVDLAAIETAKVEELMAELRRWNATAPEAQQSWSAEYDPASDPQLRGGCWRPWK